MADNQKTPWGLSEKEAELYQYYYNMFLSNPKGMANFTMPETNEARVAAQKAAEQIINNNPVATRQYSYGGNTYDIPLDGKTTGTNGNMDAVTAAKLFLRKYNTYLTKEQSAAGKVAKDLGNGKGADKTAIKESPDKQYWGTTSAIPSPEQLLNDPSAAGQTLTMLHNQEIAAGSDANKVAAIKKSQQQVYQVIKNKMDSDPTYRAVALYVYYSSVKFRSQEEEATRNNCLQAYKSIYDNWISSKKPMLSDGVKETNKKAQEATTQTYQQKTPKTFE